MRTTETIRTWTGAALAAAAALALAATSAAAQRSFNPSNPGVWQTDFTKHSVPFEEIFSGGVPRDGIPPIDDPQTGQIADVEAFISDTEPVITVQVNGAARAYPLGVLMRHEIVNDELGGMPITVTFCPLCNSAVVFDRRVNGQILDFGVSGNLRFSDLIMWDRQTQSWWQQFVGEAIVGEMTGTLLDILPVRVEAFSIFKERFPEGTVNMGSRRRGQPGGTLDPAEHLLDTFAVALANLVAGVPQGSSVDRRLAPLAGLGQMTIDGDVRGHGSGAQVGHEPGHVIGLVGAQGDPPLRSAAAALDQIERRLSLGRTAGLGDAATNRQTVAVLHQGMTEIAELGRLAVALAVELGVRIGGAPMGLVGALLAVEVAFAIAARAVIIIIIAPIRLAEALHRRPGFEQCPVHREVVVGDQPLHLRLSQHGLEELGRDLTFQQPVAVLREGRVVPHRIVHAKPREPAEQKIELNPLHQLTLGPDPIERL